jgi:NADH-quinone oxidoreductase subunit K
MIVLADYLIVAAALLVVGVTGLFMHRKNLIILLMCLELILLAVNTNFIAFARFLDNALGEVFVFFVLTVAASEAAIGLAIVVLVFRTRKTIDVEALNSLKG